MVKPVTVMKDDSTSKTIMIMVPNVWGRSVKMYMHQVVEVESEIADLLVKNKQAKETRDDPTHYIDYVNGRGYMEAV